MSIAALILGILSIVNCWDGGGIIFGIVAMILGSKALAANAADKKAKVGKTLGLVSIIIDAVAVVIWIIVFATIGCASMN